MQDVVAASCMEGAGVFMEFTQPKGDRMSTTEAVEIVTFPGQKLANYFLDRGYRLLSIQGTSKLTPQNGTNPPHVRRRIEYVLGRPESVEHIDISEANEAVYPKPKEPEAATA